MLVLVVWMVKLATLEVCIQHCALATSALSYLDPPWPSLLYNMQFWYTLVFILNFKASHMCLQLVCLSTLQMLLSLDITSMAKYIMKEQNMPLSALY